MKNNRIEIVVASVLLISFFFFIVSYSNYDLRKKRGWNGETAQFVYINRKAIDRDNKTAINRKDMKIFQFNLSKSELQFHGIYSQLLFQRKKNEITFNLKSSNYT